MIRRVQPSDAQAICDIYNDYVENSYATFDEVKVAPEEFRSQIESNVLPWLVFLDDSEPNGVIGHAFAKPWKERAAYRYTVETSVYIASNAVGQRVGTKLYEQLFHELKDLEIHTAIAGVALPNQASVALHEKFGFEKVAHFQQTGRKFERWIDVGYWQKTINEEVDFEKQ